MLSRKIKREELTALLLFSILFIVFFYVNANTYNCAPSKGDRRREAIVTILSGPLYLPGAINLAYSVKKHSPKRDLIGIMPQNSNYTKRHLEMLKEVGYEMRVVEHMPVPVPVNATVANRFRELLVKLYAFNMTQYEVISLIDADVILTNSLDGAFNALYYSDSSFAGVRVPIANITTITKKTADFHVGHVNGGVLFLKPSVYHFTELVEHSVDSNYYDTSLVEQNLLNTYFNEDMLTLPNSYNFMVMFRDVKTYWKDMDKAKCVHYLGGDLYKPWNKEAPKLHESVRLWRREFAEVCSIHNFVKEDFERISDNFDLDGLF